MEDLIQLVQNFTQSFGAVTPQDIVDHWNKYTAWYNFYHWFTSIAICVVVAVCALNLMNSFKRKQPMVINVTATFLFSMMNWSFVYWIDWSGKHAFWYNLLLFSATAEFCLGLIGMAALTGIFMMDKFKKFKMLLSGGISILALGNLFVFSWWFNAWLYLFLWLLPKNLIIGFVLYLIKMGLLHNQNPMFGAKSKKFGILGIHIYFASIVFELVMYFILFGWNAGTYGGGKQTHFFMWCWFLFMIMFTGITFIMGTFFFMEGKGQQSAAPGQGTLDQEHLHQDQHVPQPQYEQNGYAPPAQNGYNQPQNGYAPPTQPTDNQGYFIGGEQQQQNPYQ